MWLFRVHFFYSSDVDKVIFRPFLCINQGIRMSIKLLRSWINNNANEFPNMIWPYEFDGTHTQSQNVDKTHQKYWKFTKLRQQNLSFRDLYYILESCG